MKHPLIESLEGRMFLSATIELAEPGACLASSLADQHSVQPAAAPAAARAVVKRMPRVGDTFKGTSKWYANGERQSARVVFKITRLRTGGRYTATITSPDDSGAKYTYNLVLRTNGALTMTYSGRNSYGNDTGTGSGTLSLDGKVASGTTTGTLAGKATFRVVLS